MSRPPYPDLPRLIDMGSLTGPYRPKRSAPVRLFLRLLAALFRKT